MRLPEIVSTTLSGVTARLRRDAIGYAVCAVCAVAAIIMATSASILALEPLVGVVYARLIVAGVFVAIAAATIAWLKFANAQPAATATATAKSRSDAAPTSTPQDKIAMIVEAAMLGYSMSRRPDAEAQRRRHC